MGGAQLRQIGFYMNTRAGLFHLLIARCHPLSPDLGTTTILLPLCTKIFVKKALPATPETAHCPEYFPAHTCICDSDRCTMRPNRRQGLDQSFFELLVQVGTSSNILVPPPTAITANSCEAILDPVPASCLGLEQADGQKLKLFLFQVFLLRRL